MNSTAEILAVRVIEKCWWSYRDRQVFKLLKDALCKAVMAHLAALRKCILFHAIAYKGNEHENVFLIISQLYLYQETSVSFDVISKICPAEAALLKDKALSAKIRFR